MSYGLKDDVVIRIQAVLAEFPQVDKAILYGSRAKGNFKPGSDIDLTIIGKDVTLTVINSISLSLDDLYLPCTFDLSVYSAIDNKELLAHIEQVGVDFYER